MGGIQLIPLGRQIDSTLSGSVSVSNGQDKKPDAHEKWRSFAAAVKRFDIPRYAS